MGRRGPSPTPTPLKLLRGETRPSRVNRAEPQPIDRLPAKPGDLDDAADAVWDHVMAEFGHTGVIKASDTDVLRMYCEAVARYQEASRLLTRSGPLVKGARANEFVKNPLHQVVRDNAMLVRQLAGDLGLTPSSRSGLRAEPAPVVGKLSRYIA
jgi:P27 family predicted phage terminase small subunit